MGTNIYISIDGTAPPGFRRPSFGWCIGRCNCAFKVVWNWAMTEMGSSELVHLCPASSIRQRVRYSLDVSPTASLNLRAKIDCSVPSRSPVSGESMHALDRHACYGCAHLPGEPKRLSSIMYVSCCAIKEPPGCGSRNSSFMRSKDQRITALSDSFRIKTIGGQEFSRMSAGLSVSAK